jgi:hypothetical protein
MMSKIRESLNKFANNLEKLTRKHCNELNELRVESMVKKMCMTPFDNYNQKQNETIIKQIFLESKLDWRKKDGVN